MNGNSLEDTHEGMAKFFGIPRVEEPNFKSCWTKHDSESEKITRKEGLLVGLII